MGFLGSSAGKESACKAGNPGSGRMAGEGIGYPFRYSWASLVAQLVKDLPATWETWVWSMIGEDPLEKGKVTHSSILAWKFHGLYSPWSCKESDMTEQLSLSFWLLVLIYSVTKFKAWKSSTLLTNTTEQTITCSMDISFAKFFNLCSNFHPSSFVCMCPKVSASVFSNLNLGQCQNHMKCVVDKL